ncbi:MAG: hypothetical protein GY820_16100 [Gammaproteobacteria bacterium]|nr:hypothetical protein [Gammaproteobacteria bacterium]
MTIKNLGALEDLELFLEDNQRVAFTVLGNKTGQICWTPARSNGFDVKYGSKLLGDRPLFHQASLPKAEVSTLFCLQGRPLTPRVTRRPN